LNILHAFLLNNFFQIDVALAIHEKVADKLSAGNSPHVNETFSTKMPCAVLGVPLLLTFG